MKKRDISGQRFGAVIAICASGKDSTGKTLWECKCDCCTTFNATMLNLMSGNTKSCGCKKYGHRRVDLRGKRFGRLLVVDHVDNGDGVARWACECDCGNTSIVPSSRLNSGKTKSCGCFSIEVSRERAKTVFNKSGPEHPRWLPDKSDDERARARTNEFKLWSRAVKLFYDFTCQRCGERGGKLNSHHILSYSEYPSHRFNVHNGMCLCIDCHKEFHSKYGVNGFTLDDNIDFILKYQYGK